VTCAPYELVSAVSISNVILTLIL